MKPVFALILSAALLPFAPAAGATSSDRAQATVILDANTVANLRLEYAAAEPRVFESTVFALGRLEARPGATAAVSSRIAGRVVSLAVSPGDTVAQGDELVRVESRVAGDPPPVVGLAAPLSGVVTALRVHVGDPVEPAASLLEIADLSVVHAVARMPEAALGSLRVGETEARVRLAAFPGETFVGRLARLAPAADPATGTIAASFELQNDDGRLRPGLRAEFAVVTARRADVLAVPREAVQGEGVGPRFVFVKDPALPHAFVKTPVVLGATNDRQVEITGGLAPGAEVVARGAYSLAFADGGTVSLKQALDAAHGHEHAEDGSELRPASAGEHEHDHGDDHDDEHPGSPWRIATVLLGLATLALLIALARRRHA